MGTRLIEPQEKRLVVLGGSSHPELTNAVVNELGDSTPDVQLSTFANGERRVFIENAPKEVGGADVFVLQAHGGAMSVDSAIFEHGLLINAALKAGAKRITAVCTCLGYARQDKYRAGEPLAARQVTSFLRSSGASRLLAIDLHADQIQGYFDKSVDHLEAWPVLVPHLRNVFGSNRLSIVSPDAGRAKAARLLSNDLDADIAVIHKRRDPNRANVTEALEVIGEVEGRTCVINDDLIDTGGSVVKAAIMLKQKGAGDIWVVATHGVFSEDALCRLGNKAIKGVIVTDTLPKKRDDECTSDGPHKHADVEYVSIAPLLGRAIREIFDNGSVSILFSANGMR